LYWKIIVVFNILCWLNVRFDFEQTQVLEEDDMSELEEETDVGEDLPEGNEISDTEEDDDNDSPRAKRRKEEEDEYEK